MPLEIKNFTEVPNEIEIDNFEVNPQMGIVILRVNLNNRKYTPPASGSTISGSVVTTLAQKSVHISRPDAINMFYTIPPAGTTLYDTIKGTLYSYISNIGNLW